MADKPQGKNGPVKIGDGGAEWDVTKLPGDTAERERLVADLFVNGFERWVATESEPSLKPFGAPVQNEENDLDFTVPTNLGEMLMELAEFAPLAEHGPKFESAPPSLPPKEKGALATALVSKKSGHQGGANRLLVLYVTEQGFWLDPFTIEWMRRLLTAKPPAFERVYYVSIHSLTDASVSEIYPGQPNHNCVELTDEEFAKMNILLPHAVELVLSSGVVHLKPDKA